MKYTLFLAILLTGTFISCQSKNENSATIPLVSSSSAKVEVYNFHTTNRCITCMAIEENTKRTISENFANEVDNGSISLHVVNVDLPENAALAEQFKAFGTSLFIRVNKGNKSEIINLSDFAFMNARNEASFKAQLNKRIETYF
jgi:hypothetical protein